jgi:LysM repeat protein
MSEYDEISEAEEPVVVEHITVVEEPSPAGEMLRFYALIIILGVVILVVAVTRPLIFGRIVPAVMGEGIVISTPEPPATDGEEEADTPIESPDETEPATEETTDMSDNGDEAATPEENTADSASSAETNNEAETTNESNVGETAENETTPTMHIVQEGDTLQKIAAQYGVTLQELIAANGLVNPDYIQVADELVIPRKNSNP